MTREELDQYLALAIRKGSVSAMRLWVDAHRAPQDATGPRDNLVRFDELARRRRTA